MLGPRALEAPGFTYGILHLPLLLDILFKGEAIRASYLDKQESENPPRLLEP